jgi:replicative DNA helicase
MSFEKISSKPLELLFGIIMTSRKDESARLFRVIKQEWLETEEQKQLYQLMSELFDTGEEVNLLTVGTTSMKKEGGKKLVIYASKLTGVPAGIDYHNVGHVIEMIRYNYVSKGAKETMLELHRIVSSDDIDFDKYIDLMNNAIVKFNKEVYVEENGLTDVIRDVLDRHDRARMGDLGGILLGFKNLNKDVILEPVDMMVVGARPAMGKTSFGVAALCQLVFHEKRKVAYFNLEMSNNQIMRRIIANLTGIDSNKIKYGQCSSDELMQIHRVISMPEMKNITLYEGSQTIQQMKMKLTELKHSDKVEVFIVDYLQKIAPERGKTRYEQVTEASNGIKYISQNMKIPCIALAQLGRDAGKSGSRPILPDLRESGEIEQDASIVAFLHRPEYYGHDTDENGQSTEGKAEFIIAKNREGDTPILKFNVDLKTSQWTEDGEQRHQFQQVETYRGFHEDNPF